MKALSGLGNPSSASDVIAGRLIDITAASVPHYRRPIAFSVQGRPATRVGFAVRNWSRPMPKQSHSSAPSSHIRPLIAADQEAVVALSLLAWDPVFISFENILGSAINERIYRPDPRTAQAADVRRACSSEDVEAFVTTTDDDVVAGFVALKRDVEAALGIIEMIAVHPRYQRHGHGRALMEFAIERLCKEGFPLINVGTGGDPGHAPARALYEALGFTGLPLVNYYMVVHTS